MESIHRPQGIRIMSRPQVADALGVSPKTLANWASFGTGPSFTRVGGRAIYKVEDVSAYAEATLGLVA